MTFLKRIGELDSIPKGYGVAWRETDAFIAVCAPLPLNRLLAWLYRRYTEWRVDRTPDILTEIYDLGFAAGCRAADRQIAWVREHRERDIENAIRRTKVVCEELYWARTGPPSPETLP